MTLTPRYACYLIFQNRDRKKERSTVIFEQTGGNKNFGMIRSKVDQTLFNNTAQQIKYKWEINKNKPLADFMPSILLKIWQQSMSYPASM